MNKPVKALLVEATVPAGVYKVVQGASSVLDSVSWLFLLTPLVDRQAAAGGYILGYRSALGGSHTLHFLQRQLYVYVYMYAHAATVIFLYIHCIHTCMLPIMACSLHCCTLVDVNDSLVEPSCHGS
jgi:hypothetical protein